MAGTDIVFFYRDPNTGEDYYGVRDLYDAWVAAGKPPINSAGRLYAVQKAAWNNSPAMGGTGSPADNPDQPQNYELGHCRLAALDITATPDRVRRLEAAGLVRPFSWESWHWRLRNLYNYPIIHSIPASASSGATSFDPSTPIIQEDDMAYPISVDKTHRFLVSPGFIKHFDSVSASDLTKNIVTADDKWIELTSAQFLAQLDSFGVPRWYVDHINGGVMDPSTGKVVRGGVWSWARAGYESTQAIAKAIAKPTVPEVVTPPKG